MVCVLRMMVPALLFIEKPYYDNLMAKGDDSPFKTKSAKISLVYIVMVLKTCCILYVNLVLIYSDDCQSSTTGPQHACSNADDATSDGLISSTNIVGANFVPKLAVLGTCAHSLIFLYSMVWTHMGRASSSQNSDSDSDGESESESESESDDDDDNSDTVANIGVVAIGAETVSVVAAGGAATGANMEPLEATAREQMACLQADKAMAPGTRIRAKQKPEGHYVSCKARPGRRNLHVVNCGDEHGEVEMEFDPTTTSWRVENGVIVCEDRLAW
jgi:hypothetical protein